MGQESFKPASARSEAIVERLKTSEKIPSPNVEDMIRESRSFFVHDIVLEDYKPSGNNHVVDTKRLSFKDSLNIVGGAENLALSCSSVRYGSKDRTFGLDTQELHGAPGVFLRKGKIVAAHAHDSGTRAISISERDLGGMSHDAQDPKVIRKVLMDREGERGNRYNEIVVSNPEIAGVYFRLDAYISDDQRSLLEDSGTLAEIDDESRAWKPVIIQTDMQKRSIDGRIVQSMLTEEGWSRLENATEQALPLFALTRDNKVFHITYFDKAKGEIWLTKGAVEPEKLLAMTEEPPPGVREVRGRAASDILASHNTNLEK